MNKIRRNSLTMDKLRFVDGRLYGREEEERALQDVYRHVVMKEKDDSTKKEMVVVTGNSGTGKTSLVDWSLRLRVRKRGDFFITGKFNLMERSTPYAAIIAALEHLPNQLNDPEMGVKLQKKIGREVCNVVAKCIPALRKMLFAGEEDSTPMKVPGSQIGGVEGRHQFNFAFRTFMRKLCEENGKIMVLFIEDLQWADAASLELLEILAMDKGNHSLLIICSYRDNEVSKTHPVSVRLREIEQSDVVNMNKISIGNLNKDVVNSFIADTVNMSAEATKPLSAIVHSKTHGNIFFVIQFLKTMEEEELLSYSIGLNKWIWDAGRIDEMCITSNVVDLMLARLRKVPEEQLHLLALSSCLGSCFDLTILILVVDFLKELAESENTTSPIKDALRFLKITSDNVQACLDDDLHVGLLEKQWGDSFRFSHDHVQKASFETIPVRSREILQWCIGQAFVTKLPPGQLDQVLFGAVDLLNIGREECLSTFADNSKELLQLARLNFNAGIKARSVAAHQQSVTYLETCIQCLNDVSGGIDYAWIQHHDFCLEAYQAFADSLFCIGIHTRMKELVDIIFKYTSSKEGRMSAYATLIGSLVALDKYREAFDAAFLALSEYGDVFPKQPSKLTILKELLQMKQFMKRYNMETLRNLPRMDDPPRAILMKILVHLCPHAYLECSGYLPLIVFRLVKWNCLFGLCSSSPPTFALYGLILAGALGDTKGGYEYTTFAMKLFDESKDKSEYALTNLTATMVRGNLTPVVNCAKDYLYGYQIGMENGESRYAILNLASMILTNLSVGRPLSSVAHDLKLYTPHFKDYGQVSTFKRALPIWQFVVILMGTPQSGSEGIAVTDTISTCELTGELMNEGSYLKQFENEPGQVCVTYVFKQLLAYYLGNFDLAGEFSDKTQDYDKKHRSGDFLGIRYVFVDGLTAMAMLGMNKHGRLANRKWQKRKSKCMKKMTEWQKQGNVNTNHMLLLLEAEQYALKKNAKIDDVRAKFDSAQSRAAKAGFAHDSALSNERAGVFCSSRGELYWAETYIVRAHQCWSEYGAHAVCRQLEDRYPQFITDEIKESSMHVFQGAEKRNVRRSMHRKSIVFKDATDDWTRIRSSTLRSTDSDRQTKRTSTRSAPPPSSSASAWSTLNMSEKEYKEMQILAEDSDEASIC